VMKKRQSVRQEVVGSGQMVLAAESAAPENRLRAIAPLLLVGMAMFAAALYFPKNQPLVDEYVHWADVQSFAKGGGRATSGSAIWPTSSAIIGWTLAVLGQASNIVAGRLAVAVFGLLAMFGFYEIAKDFDANSARLRTAQFFLSPVVLPFCALVYTDIPALSCLLWSAVGAVRRKPWLMIGAGLLACAIRQNEITWFVALAGLLGWLILRNSEKIRIVHCVAAGGVVLAWLGAVYLQQGVASSAATRADHPLALKGIPNIWFALAAAGLIYLPYFLYRLFEERVGAPVWQYSVLGILVTLTFEVTHQFNLNQPTYFIRNYLLHLTQSVTGMGVFVVIVTTMAVLVWRIPLLIELKMIRVPFLVFCALSVLPFWVIEQRYYLPMYALFWAMRPPIDRRFEYVQLAFGAAATAWLVVGMARVAVFL
jgi:hypothetical protein